MLIITTLCFVVLLCILLLQSLKARRETARLLHDVVTLQQELDVYVEAAEADYKDLEGALDISSKRLANLGEQNEELRLHLSEAMELNVSLSDELDKLQSRELPQLHEMRQASNQD